MKSRYSVFVRISVMVLFVLTLVAQPQTSASALTTLTVTPITWNVIGLDSNNVNVGPNHFPIAVRVCNTGTESATNVTAVYNWDSTNSLIEIRPSTLSTVNLGTLAPNTCADAYFEVEVTRNSSAYDTTRDYHISVTAGNVTGTVNTPIRELYVEHLVSQNRNATTNVEYGTSLGSMASVPAGGTMNLMVGNTYFIRLTGFTATQGYEQLETFLNIPNTIFQTLSVSTTYTADTSTTVSSPNDKLYGDGCVWENNQSDPNYRSCLSTGKVGGDITVTYQVRILQVPSSPLLNPQPLSSLIYDFSGSSYHYNADYSVGTRYANIINASIEKSFSPKSITPGSNSTLTFTINNPGSEALTNVNFTDDLPNNVNLANSSVSYNSGCGSPSPTSGSLIDPLTFSNITVAGSSTCVITATVTSNTNGTYSNTTSTLKIGTTDTGDTASDTLVVSSAPAPPNSCTTRTTMATWTFENYSALAGNTITSGDSGPFDASSDVLTNTPTGTYVSQGSSESAIIDRNLAVPASWTAPDTGNDSAVWGIRNAWPSSAPVDVTNPTSPFFQFQVNTDGLYGGVGIKLDYNLLTSGAWSNSGPWYILFSTNGTTWSNLSPILPIDGTWAKSAWITTGADAIDVNSTSTSSTVYFRLYFVGTNNAQIDNAHAYIDNVVISGCPTPPPPTISKSFGTDPVSVGSNSTLTFTISNTTSGNSALTGVNFTDVLPGGLLIASTPNLTNSCNGTPTAAANTSTISLTGVTLAAGATCTISVSVRGVSAGSYTNTSTNISSTESGANTSTTPNVGFAQDTIVVISPPVIQKSFTANPIFTGNTTTLNFSINNPNPSTTLTGISFTDTLPAGLDVTNASSAQCSGTLTLTNNSPAADTVTLTGGSLAAGATCSFSVTVTGTTAGLKNNSVTVSSTNGGTGNTDTADVVVRAQTPAISTLKSVSTSNLGPWSTSLTVTLPGSVYYRFIVENVGDIALSNVNISDPNVSTSTCTWTDGDGTTISTSSANFSLPVADANDNHIATCIVGPITAALGVNPNTVTADDNNPSGTPTTSDTSTATYTGIQPNLTVSKTDSDADNIVILPSATFDWTITVTNNGTATANFANTQVIMSDALPGVDAYYTLGSITETNGGTAPIGTIDCAIVAGPSLSCVANGAVTLPPSASFSLTFTVNPTATGALANTAIVDPNNVVSESNENASDNQSTNTINVQDTTDLAITKTDGVTSVNAGASTTYTIVVTNSGSSTANNAVFTDPVATGLNVTAVTCGSASGGAACPTVANTTIALMQGSGIIIPTLPSAGSVTFSVTATVTVSGGSVANTANIATPSGTTDSNPANNSATDTDTVTPVSAPALTITKTGTLNMTVVPPNGQANTGDVINYTITVSNIGDTNLSGVSVSDPLLDSTGNDTLDCDNGTLGNQTTGLTISTGNSLTCPGSYTLTQTDLNTNGGGDGDIDNTATAGSNETSPVTVTDDEEVPIQFAPAIQVTKTVFGVILTNPDTLTITYLINVANIGNVPLTNVQVTDDLTDAFDGNQFSVLTHTSTGTTFLTVNGGPTGFDGDTDQNLLAGTDTLNVGASGQITLVVEVDTDGIETDYLNTATGTGTPPTGPNVTDDDSVGLPSFVDPALAKSANPNQASVGEVVTFTITVTNDGTLPAPNVIITDTLPPQFDVTAVNVTGNVPPGTGTTVNGTPYPPVTGTDPFTVRVALGADLGVNDVIVIQITTVVNSLGNPPIVNNALLTTTAQTNTVLNDTDSVEITLISSPTNNPPAMPDTGFAPNKVTRLPAQPAELTYSATDVILEIPSLGLKMPIVGVPLTKNGWDVTWLTNQAGWLEGSAFPSWNGNSVLTSHVTLANGLSGPFANLSKLKYGDQIIIHANGQKYIYEIRTNATVAPDSKSYFRSEKLPWLTLITCKEYDERTDSYKKRVVVRAVLIEVIDK